ncbi:D-alanine--D-alanine ligase [Moorella humiferrea]|uniref:D-alanine--D-alanine ligase family protein n=1 Tax=Neomoorella humiferrea TaxID=676965 RepID=UPI0030CD2040
MLRILFLFNAVPAQERRGPYSDCLSWETVINIYRALLEGGSDVYPVNVRSRRQLEKSLSRLPAPHLAFVLAEGFLDEPHTLYDGSGAAQVRFLLQKYGIPASHSPAETMEICRHKNLTYQVLQRHSLPVPPYKVIDPGRGLLRQQMERAVAELGFPLFVKPNGGGNSIGISDASKVFDFAGLERQVKTLLEILGKLPVLVERYLPGQEFTVGLIGRSPCYILPPIAFLSRKIRTSAIKGKQDVTENIFPEDIRYQLLSDLAVKVLAATGARDALRIDLRSDSEGGFYIIDVNGTPSLSPAASLTAMAMAAGLRYSQFINFILYQSLLEYGLVPGVKLQDLVAPALGLLHPYLRETQPLQEFSA